MMSKVQVYILHGYNATPKDHWFPWLQQKLVDQGIQAQTLALPNPENPELSQWIDTLKQSIANTNDQTFFVAHSLGCIALLNYLNQLNHNTNIGGMILVSGFNQPVPNRLLLDSFVNQDIDIKTIVNMTQHRVMIASEDDPIVPFILSQQLSDDLSAMLIAVEQGGHFLGREGFTRLPIVYDELMHMLNGKKDL